MRETVLVVGAGPAGRAAAAACAEAGLPVVLVDPDPARPWPHTYGAWHDEIVRDLRDDVLARRYDAPVVRTGRHDPIVLPRTYALLDNEALHAALRERLHAAGGREIAGRARRIIADADGAVVTLDHGRALEIGVVIDAAGHRPALLAAGAGPPPAWQTAYGVVGRFDPAPVPPGGACFMDWRPPGRAAGAHATFSYVLDLGDGMTLVEETALAARPAVPLDALQGRLDARLERDGTTLVERVAVERVRFPMGGPLPRRSDRVIGFGAAAGMVHPATGYQVAAALDRAPALAAALAAASAQHATPAAAAAAGWDAVWPVAELRARALHRFGLEVLLRFDQARMAGFFEAFFSLPPSRWSAFVSRRASGLAVARAMAAVARRLPPGLRASVVGSAFHAEGRRLLPDLLAATRSR